MALRSRSANSGSPAWPPPTTRSPVTPMARCHYLGFIVEFGPWCLFHSGDTLLAPRPRPSGCSQEPDRCLLPINGNKPERRVAGNLNGSEAAALARACGARMAIPCHYDMFEFNTETPEEFSACCDGSASRYVSCAMANPWTSAPSTPRTSPPQRFRNVATIRFIRAFAGFAGPILSLGLHFAVTLCYINRWDKVAAVTVFPLWAWAIVGLLILAVSWLLSRNKFAIAVAAVWGVTAVVGADEIPGIVNSIKGKRLPLEHPQRQDGKAVIRVATINCKNRSAEALLEAKSYAPDIVLVQESPACPRTQAALPAVLRRRRQGRRRLALRHHHTGRHRDREEQQQPAFHPRDRHPCRWACHRCGERPSQTCDHTLRPSGTGSAGRHTTTTARCAGASSSRS